VNAPLTELFAVDVEAVGTHAQAVMIAKAEPGQDWSAVGSAAIVPLIETARGLTGAAQLLTDPRVARPALGTIDLAVELGVDPDDQQALLWARSAVVAAAAAAGVGTPIDGVTTRIDDADALAADVRAARRLGLRAKLCIHPRQIAAVHEGMRATAAEEEWARAVLAASTDGVSTVDGAMIDAPVVNRARQLLATLG
jgi:citrate lyase subunit beta/citryl-CoA lyase